MKRFLILLMLLAATPSLAAETGGEGYARPTFREVIQTITLLGGFDINKNNIADEYGRLIYCPLYKKNFENDVAWNRIRSQIVQRVTEKKEPYRVLYEVTGEFRLGRYDFGRQQFPISEGTAMVNVGSVSLFNAAAFQPYCDVTSASRVFPTNISVRLSRPLTVSALKIPQEKVEKLVARLIEMKDSRAAALQATGAANMEEEGDLPKVYGRIRLRMTDVPNTEIYGDTIAKVELAGDVMAVDFFLDQDLTKKIGSVSLKK